MTDDLLSNRITKISHEIRQMEATGNTAFYYERLERLYDTLVDLEAVKVQRDLVSAQHKVAAAQDAATKVQIDEAALQNQIRGRSDEQSYWFRRFLTSLTVAHGVGLATSLTALMRTPAPQVSTYGAFGIVATFAIGLTLMGILPLPMARIDTRHPDEKKDKIRLSTANWISAVCAAMLALGIVCVGKVALDTFHYNLETASATKKYAPEIAPPPSPASR